MQIVVAKKKENYFVGTKYHITFSLVKFGYRFSGMEGKFQAKSTEDDATDQNNKRSPMTLNVSGLWDVVPRLDHYRLVLQWFYQDNTNTIYTVIIISYPL